MYNSPMTTVPHTLEPVHFNSGVGVPACHPYSFCGDCLEILEHFPANCADLIYIDQPFNANRNHET
jgi:hypothetical protein